MTIIEERLAWFEELELKAGKHDRRRDGACALEAAAYLAGEKWSDHPECVCPTIAAFGRSWNDALSADDRNRLLKPLIPKMIGTRSTPDVQDARAFMAADWAVRVFTVAWLRKAGLNEDADALAALPELSTTELCKAAMPVIGKARANASAAGAAAGDAAWAAARDAAWAAARDAAGDAARAAARDALQTTVTELQASAVNLLERMIAA